MSSDNYSVIVSVDDDGEIVQLIDGSAWQIPPGDNTRTVCWYETQRVVIEESDDPIYRYRLRNLDTSGDVVKATRIR